LEYPQWQTALELVEFSEIGKITSIHTFFGYNNIDPSNIRNIKEAGGGAILDIGCYAVSTARFLLQAEPKRVISMMNIDEAFQTDIVASGILDFGTVRSLFTVSTQTYPYQTLQVYGTGGIMTIEIPFNIYPDIPAKVNIQNVVGSRTLEVGPANQYQLEFEQYALAIRNRTATPIPPEDAVNNLKVIDALFKSAGSGKWENVL
jgi:predicted dehydrogenase